ncbi:MAG: N-acetylmuramoyl-L-alanine amidase, partial [Ferruginibacter sp.]
FYTNAQNNNSILDQVNNIIKNEKEHLPNINFAFIADSISYAENKILIYFNKDITHTKASLPSDYVEILPELLLPISTNLSNTQIILLAKENITNEWKSIEYFANHPPTQKYIPIINNDPYPAKLGANNVVSNRVFPTTGSPTPVGALAGKTVWLSPGHGWQNTGSGFTTQRGTTNGIVEDFITAESIDYYLMGYLYNAGANVWSVRERDVNPNEIIVDNDVPASGYSETGTWANGSVAGYGGTYRVATSTATEDATAIFEPNVSQSGLYWVSVRCIAGANRVTDVGITIIHSGDTSKVKINQEIHGETWVYVGQFYFTAGSTNKIILSNESMEVGQAIIADAVRLGGGVGADLDCLNTSQPASNRSRFEESARQYAKFQGHPPCVEDVTVRPKYSEYELSKGTATEINNAVFVSWHTNAGGGNGTESYVYNQLGAGRPNITAGSIDLRNFIHTQLIADIRAAYNPAWVDRGVKVANQGETRELNTIPGTLIELAFHDLAANATDLKNPEFRRIAARAIYKGVLKFFNNRDGIPLVFLPEQPTNVVAKNIGSNNIQISWIAPVTGGANGDVATAYKLYISTNGKSFKDGINVVGNNYTFNGNAGTIYYFKVSATNAGGESFTSSVVAAKTPKVGSTNIPYLIVDGFDRLDGSALIKRTESAGLGVVSRMFLVRMNRYDYMIEHAEALGACNINIAFDGCQNEAVINGTVLLSTYNAVDWFTGEESTIDRSLDATEISLLKAYLNAGGNLLITGAEIGWDIGRAASANVDLDFYNNYLKANYIGDDAGSYDFTGTAALFNTQSGTFDNSTNGYYDVDFPDRVSANGGGTVALNYVAGTADGAAIGFQGSYKSLYFAFPFEAITSTTVRNNLMCNTVAYLTPALVVPITGLTIFGKNIATQNLINFKTLAEINTKHFEIERSENGIIFYTISNQILPKGNYTTGANYSFIDKNILPSSYYRIKVVDNDGRVSYSEIISLVASKTEKLFTIVNNPTNTNIKLTLLNNTASTIILTNAIGQVVYTKNIANTLSFSIDVSMFAKGIYQLVVLSKNNKQVERIIVQ